MRWDIFCRVIDNHGDIGVCWRLARDLAQRGHTPRLWLDDARALAWMAPERATSGVQVVTWQEPLSVVLDPGDVVVEAFGCDPPRAFVQAMAARAMPPCWINLEYLSAEPYVQRSHGLASPQFDGPGRGLTKWFFYPGFGAGSGGLQRESDLLLRRAAFDRDTWLAGRSLARRSDEQVVVLFCYPQAPLAQLISALASRPTLLLVSPGLREPMEALGPTPSSLRIAHLPWLSQVDFDHLLWCADVNFVRGEDSFVRAQWAGAPFVWHIYAQHDGAHAAKLEAFMDLYLAAAPAPVASAVRQLWRAWNALAGWPLAPWPARAHWTKLSSDWRASLGTQPDLTHQLLKFVRQRFPLLDAQA